VQSPDPSRAAQPARSGAACSARTRMLGPAAVPRRDLIAGSLLTNAHPGPGAAFMHGMARRSARAVGSLPGATDRQALDLQGRLTYAHRNALPVLAARAHPVIQLQVVAHHRDSGQHVGPVADQGGAFQGGADAAVLDGVGLTRGENELARSDVHLAAAEVDGIDATGYRADDLLGIVGSRAHVGVGHARQGHVRERLAPAVAGGPRAHEAGVEPVLHVTPQHAILDERGAFRRSALIVEVEGAASLRRGAVVDDGALRSRGSLADAIREGGGALAVEITLE